ncbi:MAG: 50S ribosomal protein L15 [Clostridia bacterium]|nr:50S ribosomal protein L15 [Clostridia bacterium]
MIINELKPAMGAKKAPKRLGRGIGSGTGKTAGKGHKGQWARSGGGVRPGFEGQIFGLTRRLPKAGFDNNWRKVYSTVNVSALEAFEDGATVTAEVLLEKGILSKIEPYGLKVLGVGELTKKLNVVAKKFTKSAEEKIKAVGGTAEVK